MSCDSRERIFERVVDPEESSPVFPLVVHEKVLATTSPKMVVFVASDNLSRAMSFGYKLISGTGHCKNFQT